MFTGPVEVEEYAMAPRALRAASAEGYEGSTMNPPLIPTALFEAGDQISLRHILKYVIELSTKTLSKGDNYLLIWMLRKRGSWNRRSLWW